MKKGKSVWVLIIIFIGVAYLGYLINDRITHNKKSFKIGVIYLLQHPSIDQGIEGFKSELQKIETESGIEFKVEYKNAMGEPKNVNGFISNFREKKSDIIIALTTPCAQIAKKLIKTKPVVFVGVSDPVSAGLVKNLNSGFENITGTTSKDPNFETLELAKKLFPAIKKVGIIYTSSEANSTSILLGLDEKIKSTNLGIEIIKRAITNTTEILPAIKSILPNVDAIFTINDNTVVSSIDLLIRESKAHNKPLFASDVESVNKGALFTYGLNYRDEGVASADILKQILLDNKVPSEIPVYINSKYYLFVNKQLLKYDIDTALIKGAEFVGK